MDNGAESPMWLYRANEIVAPLLRLYWRMRIVGEVESIPREGPFLLASNHASFLDPWLLGLPFPRRIRFLMLRRWYYRSRLWNTLFRAWGAVPVQEDSLATVATVCRLLDRGHGVGVFPEGRITTDGTIRRFRRGVAVMAAASGVPVVPVAIRGSFDSMPRWRRFPRPVQVTIHVGAPRRFPGAPYRGQAPPAEQRAFLDDLHRDVCRLAGR